MAWGLIPNSMERAGTLDICYFSYGCNQILDKNNLREERFSSTPTSRWQEFEEAVWSAAPCQEHSDGFIVCNGFLLFKFGPERQPWNGVAHRSKGVFPPGLTSPRRSLTAMLTALFPR